MSEADNEAAVWRAFEAWNRGDLEGYLSMYDREVVLHGYQGVEPGFENVRRFYQGITAAFPDAQLAFDDVFSNGERVTIRFRIYGTHQGPLMGIPATGKPFDMPGITILHFNAAGKCYERWSQADFMLLLQQLGAMPAPAAA